MTACKLLDIQELLHKALTDNDMTCVAAALVEIDLEVAEMLFTDDEKSELEALWKED